jgi:hypothetical protein
MTETETHASKPKTEKAETNIDVTEIIQKVRDFVGNVKEMVGKPMDVKVDSFNFNFSKTSDGQYNLNVDTKIKIKPKQA